MVLKANLKSTTYRNGLYSLKRDVGRVEGTQQGVTEMIKGLEK